MNFEKKAFFLRKEIPYGQSKILSKVCSQFTSVVHNVNISFDKKVDGLYNLWLTLLSFVHEKSEELDEFLDFICHFSLHIMLSDEWDSFKSISKMWFLNTIKLSKLQICKAYHGVSTQSIDTLIKLCEKPWNIPFLDKIFNNEQVEKEDILKYYNEESTCVFERIKVLCASQCEDLAFQLVDHCLTVANDKQRELLQEIHFILLLILKRKEDLVNKLRELSIDGSFDLVDSFILYSNLENLNPQTSLLYNCLESLVKESLEVLLKRVVLDDDINNFYKVMDKWMDNVVIKMNQTTSYLSSIADMFISSDQLFYLYGKLNNSMLERDKKFCIKMLMRALTVNSNEFENIEDKNDKKRSAQRLANGFLQLASLMKYSDVITRECMLSSFSLYPTHELQQKINKELCVLQSHSSDSLWSDGAIVGLSQQECDDLIILLHVHRNASLCWNLEKDNLLENCVTHMSNYNNLFEQVPLKYLNIDYSQFDNVPRPEPGFYEGIEKGYEKYLEGFSVQNVKDVVEELRFLKVDDLNKKLEELENTNGEIVPVEDCNVEIVDEEEQGIHSLKLPQHQDIDFQTPYDSNVQNKNVENRTSETNYTEVVQRPIRTRTLTARHILDAQKPLIVKINVGNTRKSNVKVRARKKPKKKKSKENKLEIAVGTLATPPSQVPMGLKRVMYPQKTKPSDSSVLKDISQQPEQDIIDDNEKHIFQSCLEGPPVKIIKQGNTLEFSTNYIDLSSYESVSNLVSGGGSNIQLHNETQMESIPYYTSSDYESLHNSLPIPLGSQDLKFVHFDMDTHHIYQEHNYFSTKFQNPECTSDSDSDLNDEDFVNIVDTEEDDGSDVDVEGLHELALPQTAAQMLSNRNCPSSSSFYEKRDQEIESKFRSSTLDLNVEFTREKELVDLASLLHCRQA